MLPSSIKLSLASFAMILGVELAFSSTLPALPFPIISTDSFFLLCSIILFYEVVVSNKFLKLPGLLLLGLFFVIFISLDITAKRYFKLPFSAVSEYLGHLGIDEQALPALYFQYVSPLCISSLAILAAVWIFYSLFFYNNTNTHKKLTILITSIYIAVYLCVTLNVIHNNRHLLALQQMQHPALKRLSYRSRMKPIVAGTPLYLPSTIIVFINESTSDRFLSAENNKLLLKDSIISQNHLDGTNLVKFNKALTNSPCTDISVPSLTTGVGPEEGYDKLHDLPFIWDLAKARGYETAFIVSTQMSFANFKHFFAAAKIDYRFSADNSGSPIINDLGIDDMKTASMTTAYLTNNPDKKLFIVVFNNSLHTPFQAKSSIPIPSGLASRHAKARYVFETFYKNIFASLQQTGRLADSLIILTGDHGEDPLLLRKTARLESHYEEFVRIPFFIRFPDNFPSRVKEVTLSNSDKLVDNLDIAPTLLDLFGLQLPEGNHYEGYSLLKYKSIPVDRLSVSMSNTEWRSWPNISFALARIDERFICSSMTPCSFYNIQKDPDEHNPITSGEDFSRYFREVSHVPLVDTELLNIKLAKSVKHIPPAFLPDKR